MAVARRHPSQQAPFSFCGWWVADLASFCRAATGTGLATSTETGNNTTALAEVQTDSLNVARAISGSSAPPPHDKIGRLACSLWAQ
eukprot:4179893-Pyramimonas_sp.AAC.1